MGGIKSVDSFDKEVIAHISELKSEEKSAILKLGSLKIGSFYHRALLFKTICDRLGVGPCELIRNRKMAWISADKSNIIITTPSMNLVDSQSPPKILSDSDECEHEGAFDDSNNLLVLDLMFKPGYLLSGNEALRYIKYYD
jgi:hypothetical protein